MVYVERFQTPLENTMMLTLLGMILSSLFHAALVIMIHYGLVLHKPDIPIVAELDLSMSTMVPIAPVAVKPETKPIPPKVRRSAPPKQVVLVPASQSTPVQEAPETIEEVMKEENREAQPCLDCPENPTEAEDDSDDTSDDAMENEAQYIPVEQAFKKPRWIKNFITSRDYPYVARQQGKDGRVVLVILIDAEGRVRDARLLQGGYDVFNEVALRKVREAIFTPAYDVNNRPVPSRVTLPIRFELR